ncbi:MAG: diadenosine tetraphosphatase [Proteobacteria bacterium]|nr:MAG: diadenosine tetraphosphatase [Pseudomonadota bacterium]
MSTYVIGDIQGCYSPLQRLLEKLKFDPSQDSLWFAGDLVSRGYESLETLRFVRSLHLQNKAIAVLGNHDISLLAAAYNILQPHRSLHAVMTAPDRDELIHWLRHLPLLHLDTTQQAILVHAGIPPVWDLQTAIICARAVEASLRQPDPRQYLEQMYGNKPAHWKPNASEMDRQRYTVNALTRMRYCHPDGKLDFQQKRSPEATRLTHPQLSPWFRHPKRKAIPAYIYFGHWSTLPLSTLAIQAETNVIALDSGCVWGGQLTAISIEDGLPASLTQVSCSDYERP